MQINAMSLENSVNIYISEAYRGTTEPFKFSIVGLACRVPARKGEYGMWSIINLWEPPCGYIFVFMNLLCHHRK